MSMNKQANSVSRLITGIVLIMVGIFLFYIALSEISNNWPALMWSIPLIIVGIFILFNKKEDSIEKIKDIKNN